MKKSNISTSNDISTHCITTLKADNQLGIKCLLQMHNGNIAAGYYDTTIRIWSQTNYQCVTIIHGHTQVVMCLIQLQSKNNNDLVSSAGELIKIWNITHFTCKATIIGHSTTIYTLLQINNTTIASGGLDKSIKLWNLKTNRFKSKLAENNEWVRSMIIFTNANGSGYIVSASNLYIHLWDINSYEYKTKLVNHLKPVSSLIQINSNLMASGSFDGRIVLWDMQKYSTMTVFNNRKHNIISMALINENYFITGFDNATIILYDIKAKKAGYTIKHHNGIITSLIKITSIDPIELNDQNGITIASGSLDMTIVLFSINNINQ